MYNRERLRETECHKSFQWFYAYSGQAALENMYGILTCIQKYIQLYTEESKIGQPNSTRSRGIIALIIKILQEIENGIIRAMYLHNCFANRESNGGRLKRSNVYRILVNADTRTPKNLLRSEKLSLIVTDSLDLSSRGTLRIEAVGNPFGSQLLSQLNTNDPLTEAEDLGVVAQDGPLDGERVVGSDGTDSRHLVGRDGDAQTGTADEETTVRLALADEFGAGNGWVRVGGLIGGGVDTDIDDGGDEGVLFESGLESLLVGLAGLIAGHDNAEGLEVGHFVQYRD